MRVGIAFCGVLLFGFNFSLANPPVKFIKNECQWDERIGYVAHMPGGALQLRTKGFSYLFYDKARIDELHHQGHEGGEERNTSSSIAAHYVQVSFKGANPDNIQPFGKQPEYYNYFIGNDPSTWSSNVSAYEGVYYSNFYPGIDLKVYGLGNNAKYDFIVSAGADPGLIEINYEGADQVFLSDGDLIIKASQFEAIEKQPIAYQYIHGEKVFVSCSFVVEAGRVRFYFPDRYDSCYPLIIDPLLIFSTFSGSTADNWGSTATPGEKGTLYSSGITNHNRGGFFPATTGAFQVSYGGLYDVSILKYDSTGSKLVYASYLGGSDNESPHSLIINSKNELFVLGTTGSSNFPTSANAFDGNYNGGVGDVNVFAYNNGSDIFVARISPDGNSLLSSTYLGGSQNDGLNPQASPLVANYGDELRGDILIDDQDEVWLSTVTSSSDFPVANSFGSTYRGGLTDALVVHLNEDLSQMIWAAFLGGSESDASHTIKIDSQGDLYVAGGSNSFNFPTTAGSYQSIIGGGVDGWIAKLRKDGSEIEASTFTGTPFFNQVYFIDLDQSDNVYVYGQTVGTFPITPGVYSNANSGQFLQKFSPALNNLQFSTVFGAGRGIPDISPTAFLVNDCDNIYMSGWGGNINSGRGFWNSSTNGMPVTQGAIQTTTQGSDFYFIVLNGDATKMLYGTFLGGNQSSVHVDGGTSRFDKSGIVYHSVCGGCGGGYDDFPTTPGAWSRLNQSANCNNAAFKFDLSSLKARMQTNSLLLDNPGLNKICFPDAMAFQNLSTGGEIYEWSFGDGSQVVRQDTNFVMHAYAEPGIYQVKLLAIDAGTCVGKDSTFATVTVIEPAGFAGPDQVMCFDAGTRLIATGGNDYQWRNWNGSFTSSEASPLINPTEDDGYVVTISDLNGCIKLDTINVKVVPGVKLDMEYQKVYDCDSRPTLLVTNNSDPDETTFIDFGDGAISDLQEVTHTYTEDGTYYVRVVGVKESCVYEKGDNVAIYRLKVPNVITPDEHPENNQFVILYGDQPLSLSTLNAKVVIYNRWGNTVFQSDNYQDNWTASNVEAGVYYYNVDVEGETTCKGWVKVIK